MVSGRIMSQPNNQNKLGLFSEMGYTTIGEPYVSPHSRPYNESASKGKQMLTATMKSKTGLGIGYFTTEFKRVFEKEGYSDVVKRRRQERMARSKKNITSQPFLPSDYTKKSSGVGNHYGTFTANVPHFSGKTKDKVLYISPPKNFICNPPKKGSGYGYVSVTLGKYAEAMSEKAGRIHELAEYERKENKRKMVGGAFKLNMHPRSTFTDNPYKTDKPLTSQKRVKEKSDAHLAPFKPTSPSKRMGNCKDGTFDKYPKHPVDGYNVKPKKPTGPKYGVFNPPSAPKSRPTDSLVRKSVIKAVNVQNYTVIQSVF